MQILEKGFEAFVLLLGGAAFLYVSYVMVAGKSKEKAERRKEAKERKTPPAK